MEMNKIEEVLVYFSLKYQGDFHSIYNALDTKEKVDEELKKQLLSSLKSKFVTIVSDDYPESLKYIDHPPFVLYYYGDLGLVDKQTIGVIGMRVPSSYGKLACLSVVKQLVEKNQCIVSGMALGIDAIAQQCAIDHGGSTIGVLGSGIDYCYPKQNTMLYQTLKSSQLVISEYPGDTVPTKEYFPKRNRIVSGLSKRILVVEAKQKSGTMITVGYALDQGKDVYSVPSDIFGYQGCNDLIRQGAKLISSASDIIND